MLDFAPLFATLREPNTTLISAITPTETCPPFYHTSAPSFFPFISDKYLSLAAPIVVYWVFSFAFHLVDVFKVPYFEARKIHESEEVLSRNKATIGEVVRAVVWQHVVQTILGYFWMEDESVTHAKILARDDLQSMTNLAPYVAKGVFVLLGRTTGETVLRTHGQSIVRFVFWWGIPFAQMMLAFFVIDTWQYTLHRACHTYKFLYRHFHSVHHRLYVPYAFGALYNHPVEGLVLDSLGAAIAEQVSFMSIRQASLLFALSTMKTVDDHCGYRLWWDPCQMFFYNNVDYHDIHHQSYGIKKNFSQPFFTNWDILLGTRMTREEASTKVRSLKIE